MAGGFSDEFILLFRAEVNQAISSIRRLDSATSGIQKTATSLNASFGKEFNAIGRYYSVMGGKQEEINEKINLVKGNIRALSKVESQGARESMVSQKALLGTLQGQAAAFQKQLPYMQQLTSGLKQMGGAAGQAGTFIEALSSGAGAAAVSMGLVGAAVAGLVAEWKLMIEPGLKFNMMIEQQQTAFTIMLRSANAARKMISDLKNVTITTGVALSDSLSATKQFLAYGFKGSEIVGSLKMLNTVAKAVNIPMNDLVYVYGTLRAQGRAYTRDLMQFGMRGIPIYEELAKVLGVNIDQVQKLTEAGNVGFNEVQQAFRNMTGEGGRFAGMLESYMNTTAGLITQIKNQWQLFTGGTATLSRGPIRSILQSFLRILEYSGGIREAINLLWGAITGLAALLVKSVEILMGVVQFYVRIWEEQWKVIKAVGTWISELKLVQDVVAGIKYVLAPIGDFLNAQVAKIKEGAAAFKEWLVPKPTVPYEIDTSALVQAKGPIYGSIWEKMTSEVEHFRDLLKKGDFKQLVEDANKSFASFMTGRGGFTPEEMMTVLMKVLKVTEDQFGKITDVVQQSSVAAKDYWADFVQYMEKPSTFYTTGTEDITTGITAANEAIRAHKNELAALEEGLKKTGTGEVILAEKVKDLKAAAYESLQKTIDTMRTTPEYMVGEGLAFLKTLQAYANQLYAEIHDKASKVGETFDSLVKKYIGFRATMDKWGDWESPDLHDFLYGTGIIANSMDGVQAYYGNLRRVLEEIKYEWKDIRDELTKGQNELGPEKFAFAMAAIDTMEAEARTNAIYKDRKDFIDHELEVAIKYVDRLEYTNLLYQTEKERILQIQDVFLRNYELRKLDIDNEERLLKIYKDQVETLTKGRAKGGGEKQFLTGKQNLENVVKGMKGLYRDEQSLAWDEASQEWVTTLKSTLDLSNLSSSVQGAVDAIGQMTAGAFEMAAGDSELMALFNKSLDPLSAIIMGLVKMAVSIENVNKVLNPVSTALEGTKAMIEGPFNKALNPLVMILVKLGEFLGESLLVPIEYIGWALEAVGAPLVFFMELLKIVVAVLRPIVLLVAKLMNPIIMLIDLLNTFTGLSTSAIQLEADRLAALRKLYDKEMQSIQDLYNVGAISGSQYESELAALKGRYPSLVAPELTPQQKQFAAWIQGIWAGVNAISQWCTDAYTSWITPIVNAFAAINAKLANKELNMAVQALGVALAGIANSMSGIIVQLMTVIADLLIALSPLLIWMINTFLRGILIPAIQLITATLTLLKGVFDVISGVISLIWNSVKWFCAWVTGDSEAQRAAESAIKTALTNILNGLITMTNGLIGGLNSLISGFMGGLNTLIELFNGDALPINLIPTIPTVPGTPAAPTTPVGGTTPQGTPTVMGYDQDGNPIYGTKNVSAATGSGYLPNDMTIQAHKGELIAPNPFATAIRNGDLVLSGPGGAGGDTYNIYGSVITERELISILAEGISKQKKQGYGRG